MVKRRTAAECNILHLHGNGATPIRERNYLFYVNKHTQPKPTVSDSAGLSCAASAGGCKGMFTVSHTSGFLEKS